MCLLIEKKKKISRKERGEILPRSTWSSIIQTHLDSLDGLMSVEHKAWRYRTEDEVSNNSALFEFFMSMVAL